MVAERHESHALRVASFAFVVRRAPALPPKGKCGLSPRPYINNEKKGKKNMSEQFYIDPKLLEKLYQLASEKEVASVIHESLTEICGNSPEVNEFIAAMKSDETYNRTFTAEQKRRVLRILFEYLADRLKLFTDMMEWTEDE